MKRKIVFISLLTLCLSVSAQQAKEDIRLNRLLVAFISVIMDDTEAVGSSEIATIISLFSC